MGFQTSLSGLFAAQTNLNVTGNNIANASTNGFKRSRAEFADLYASSFASTSRVGNGVRVASVSQQFAQGNVEFTDNSLDLSISGEGFFILRDGTEGATGAYSYTRAGAYQVNRDGFIVNSRGQRLQGFAPDTMGDLFVSNVDNPANATTTTNIRMNLDAYETSPIVDPAQAVFTTASITDFDFTPAAGSAATYTFDVNAIVGTDYRTIPATPATATLGAFTAVAEDSGTGDANDTIDYTLTLDDGAGNTINASLTIPNGGSLTEADVATALTTAGFTADGDTVAGFTIDFGGALNIAAAITNGTLSFSRADGQNFTISDAAVLNNNATASAGDEAFADVTSVDGVLEDSSPNAILTITDTDGTDINVTLNTDLSGDDGTALEGLINAALGGEFTIALDATAGTITLTDDANNVGSFTVALDGSALTATASTAGVADSTEGTTITITGPGGIEETFVLDTDLGDINALATALSGTGYSVAVGAAGDTLVFTADDALTGEFSFTTSSPVDFLADGTSEAGATEVAFRPDRVNTYNFSTSTTIYDSLGRGLTQTLYFVKDNDALNSWSSYVFVEGVPVGAQTLPDGSIELVGQTLQFNTSGQLVSQPGSYGIYDPGDGAEPLDIVIDYTDTTQFASNSAVNSVSQDGYTTGRISGISIEQTGEIFARYTNGQSETLGTVALARFDNPNGLQPIGDTNWVETFASGQGVFGVPGTSSLGLVESGALESSNVDISTQLVNMIIAQRDFQANAKMISAEDQITQTIINIR